MTETELLAILIKASVELTAQDAPRWEFIAARLLMLQFSLKLKAELTKRNIHSFYEKLKETVRQNGIRNAYLLAIAPTSSTSIIAGTTADVDPIMNKYFLEEKKGSLMPRVAPSLSLETYWLYKNAHTIDQSWSIKAAGIRQRHIDQAQSVNLYITNDFTFSKVLNLYIQAWENGVKSVYYVRSKSLEVEECSSCSS